METAGWTPEKFLREAEKMAQAGNDDGARQLVVEALRLAPGNLPGWTLGARLAVKPTDEIYCLKRVLQIDPNQAWADERLRKLTQLLPGQAAASSVTSVVQENAPTQTLELTSPSANAPTPGAARPLGPAMASLPARSVKSPAPTRQAPPPVSTLPSKSPARAKASRRRRLDPVFVFLCVMAVLFSCLFGLTLVALASRLGAREAIPVTPMTVLPGTPTIPTPTDVADDCRALIARALQVAESNCSRLGPNQVCYGNTQLSAQLVPESTNSFQARGDIIGVDQLLRISASPLDIATKDWGVAIFKMLANVPRSLPGQNVTFIVFGNTSLDNASGDLQSFYFSSQLGQITCARVPSDGILIQMSNGAGLNFVANGATITLLGTAELKARPNENMTVSVASGSASVTAAGQTQYFGAGQEVRVPLGGAGGLEPAGPPLPPSDITDGSPATCALLGINCKPGDVQRIDPTQAASAIAQALASSTASPTARQKTSSTHSVTPRLLTPTPNIKPARSATPSPVTPASDIPSATEPTLTGPTTALPPTRTPAPTALPSPSPSSTPIPSPTSTDTPLPTQPPTPTPTLAPVCQLTGGSLAVSNTRLTLHIQNSGAAPTTITSMTLDWPDVPPDQKIREIYLGSVVIDGRIYNNPPSNIPVGGVWSVGQPADRQLPANSDNHLEFRFENDLPATGYNLTINFDNGCSVLASH